MSFAQYNSGVAMGTGSSADPLRVGLIFLGLLSIVIISISFVCCIWKLIEVFIEKHRRRSVIQRREEESTEGEVQVKVDEGRCRLKLTKKFVEMLKGVISDSAAIIHHLNKAPATQEEQEQLCAAAAAAAAAAKAKKSIIPFEIV